MNDPKKIMIDVTKYKPKNGMPLRDLFMTFYWYDKGKVYKDTVGEAMIGFICSRNLKVVKSKRVLEGLCHNVETAYRRFLIENNLLGEVIFDDVSFTRARTAWDENEDHLYKEYLHEVYRQLCPDMPFGMFKEYVDLKTKGKRIYSIHKTLFGTDEFKWVQRVYNIGVQVGKDAK